jgi:hypothetical protein
MRARPLGTTHPTEVEDASALEASINAAIEACDGDMRATVRALIIANGFLEEELNRALRMISRGYWRGRTSSSGPG